MTTRTATRVRDVMTVDLVTCPADAPVGEAARLMRDRDIGDVLVMDGDRLRGIVTDRDITVRIVAEAGDVANTAIVEATSQPLVTIDADYNTPRHRGHGEDQWNSSRCLCASVCRDHQLK